MQERSNHGFHRIIVKNAMFGRCLETRGAQGYHDAKNKPLHFSIVVEKVSCKLCRYASNADSVHQVARLWLL